MSRLGTLTRRSLLVGVVAVAGGAAFGIWQARKPVQNPLTPPGGATLNPYVIIDPAGVTLIAPRAEMGQGVHTTLAALVAEELDVAWPDIRVIHGPAADAYYNSVLLQAGLPFPDYARKGWQQTLAGAVGKAGRLLSLQITGGSTSTVDAFERMRLAGAGARETLKMAAADRLDVARMALDTSEGHVIAPDGRRLSYIELAADAAEFPVPEPELRPAAQWRFLGRGMPRTDMVAKATGTATFGIDIRLPGMKFATVRMNPRLGGAMNGFDPAPALAMPGVERVIDLGTGIAVVARNTWAAMRAAEAVEIDWGPAPYPETTEAIFARIAEAFAGRRNSRLRNDGNAARALSDAADVIEAEYRLPFLAHATPEPMTATARYTGDALELWSPSQAPLVQARGAAAAVGLDPAQVTVHTPFLGGGFGRRLESDFSTLAARVARQMPGTPVQVTWSRAEDLTHDFYRPGMIARMRGAVQDGSAVALEAKIAAPSVARQAVSRLTGVRAVGPDKGAVEGAFDQPYAIPNYRVEGYLADLDIPLGFWRSVGYSHNGFIHESFIDELAHAAGRDPLDFRLDLIRPESAIAANVLDQVARMSDWRGARPAGTGRGVAFCWSYGTPVAQAIEVEDDGGRIRIARAWIACDLGRALDPGIVQAQMESGLIFGLSAAVLGEITFAGGEVQERDLSQYEGLRIAAVPRIETRILQVQDRLGGAGEPGTPPAAPALANAIFDLTGRRLRTLPLSREIDFVL